MLYIFYALLIGLALGILSAYHTELFLSALVSTLVIGAIVMRPIVLVGASASGATDRINPLAVYIDGIALLPMSLKTAVILLPVFFFLGRLLTWAYATFFKVEEVETTADRRSRIHKENGWTAEKQDTHKSTIRLRR